MKNNLLMSIISCAGLFHTATAQQQSLGALHYEIEHRHCYEVRGCIPFSSAAFYSEKGGGKQLLCTVVDSAGKLHFVSEETFHPAFVVNIQNPQNKTEGSKKVYFIGTQEFNVKDISVGLSDAKPELHYKASASKEGIYEIVILRSINGSVFAAVQTQVLNATSQIEYVFREQEQLSGTVIYKLKIQSIKGDFSTMSSTYSASLNLLSVYPNPCTDRISITSGINEKIEAYSVTDALGKTVLEGTGGILAVEGLPVSNLTPGAYMVKVKYKDDKTWKVGSFVKK